MTTNQPVAVTYKSVRQGVARTFARHDPPPAGTGIERVEARHAYWANRMRRESESVHMTRQWHDDIGFLLEALHQIETAYADLQRSEAVWREMVSDHAVASRLRPLQPLVGWRETIARQKRDVARETFDTLMGEFMSGEVYAAIAAYTSLAGDG